MRVVGVYIRNNLQHFTSKIQVERVMIFVQPFDDNFCDSFIFIVQKQ